jgi:hypothetical protein
VEVIKGGRRADRAEQGRREDRGGDRGDPGQKRGGIGARGEEEHILGSLGRVIHYGTKLRE